MSGHPPTILDPYKQLQIVLNSDGTITRLLKFPESSPAPDPSLPTPVLSKDIPINQSNGTWVRIFLPRKALEYSSTSKKLPLLVYFHGGGFVLTSAASTLSHDFCFNMAVDLPAIILSPEYRPAPEHRLPAAYDDGMEVLHWIRTTNDVWLREYADYDNCFIMGTSAGGNIAYHVGARAAVEITELEPLKIQGLILHHPFFGGSQRSESEVRLVNDPGLPPAVTDVLWDLSLPIGVDRDHEYCNPTVEGRSKLLDGIKLLGWKVLVTGCDGDPVIDRQIALANMMKEKGVQVTSYFVEGYYHGVEIMDPSRAKALHVIVKNFMFPLVCA